MALKNLYLSFDVETDGGNPIFNNLLSIGFYGIDDDLNKIFEYSANINELANHKPDQKCMEIFWNKPENKEAWEFVNTNKRNYVDVFLELSDHFKILSSQYKLKFVAAPSCFDWMFFKCYYEMVKDTNPEMYDIGFKCHCGSALWDIYKEKKKLSQVTAKVLWNKLGEVDETKCHFALDDAKCQGLIYVKIKKML